MFQKCPNCNGTGRESSIGTTVAFKICTVCRGMKIIDETTGLPPVNLTNLTPKAFDQHIDQIGKQFKNDIEK